MAKKEQEKRFNYIKKKIAKGTWQALTAALFSFMLFLGSIAVSAIYEGNGPLYIGLMGAFSIIFALMNLYYARFALRNKEEDVRIARVSVILSIGILFFWTILLSIGIRQSI